MEYTIVVAAGASDPAPLLYISPYSACTIGEYFRDSGRTRCACTTTCRSTRRRIARSRCCCAARRAARRIPATSSICTRAARARGEAAKELGGGSLTALPIIETQAGDLSAYIPTNVISITDGQIFLESDLFHQGVRPAINVGNSVSSVGLARPRSRPMRQVAGKPLPSSTSRSIRESAALRAKFGRDPPTRRRRSSSTAASGLTEILKQPQFQPLPVAKQVTIIFADERLPRHARSTAARTRTSSTRFFERRIARVSIADRREEARFDVEKGELNGRSRIRQARSARPSAAA
jgi:F-type H+-transporting ATPase subunit alpha